MKKVLFTLVTAFLLCSSAIAGESVVIDSVQYQAVSTEKIIKVVQPGEVARHAEKCVNVSSWFTRMTTCTWSKTVTGTAGGVVVTDGNSSVMTSVRGDRIFGVASIYLMVLAMILKRFTIITRLTMLTALTTFVANIVFVSTHDGPYSTIVGIAIAAGCVASFWAFIASLTIDDYRPSASGAEVKVFYVAGCVNVALMSVALSLLW